MRILSNGNVGIGTDTPDKALYVVGDMKVEGNITSTGNFTIMHTDTSTTEQLSVTNDGTGPALIVNQKGAQPVFEFQDDGTSVLKLYDGGKLGVGDMTGIASLTEVLEVNGALKIGNASGTVNGTIKYDSGDFMGRKAGSWVSLTTPTKIESNDSKVEVTDSGSNGYISFKTDNTERMRVKSDGEISVTSHIIPTTDSVYDLGSGTYKFRDIYVSENSIWVGDEFQLGVNEQGNTKKAGFRQRKKDNDGKFKVPRSIQKHVGASGAEPGKILYNGINYDPGQMPIHLLNEFMRANVTLQSGVTDIWQDTTPYDSQGRREGDAGFDASDTVSFQDELFDDISGDLMRAAWVQDPSNDSNIGYSSGYVGIGISNYVSSKLHIKGSETSANGNAMAILMENTAASNNNKWYLRAGGNGTNTPDNGFSIGDSYAYRMTITKDGYVGVNTTNPTSMFQVYKLRSNANEEPTLFNINVSGNINTGKDLSRIAFTEGTSTISDRCYIATYNNGGATATNSGYGLKFYVGGGRNASANVSGAGNIANVMTIDPNGNLGVGVNASMNEKLEINGAVKLSSASSTADGTIQYNGSDFLARKSGSWVSLTSGDVQSASNLGSLGEGIFGQKSGTDLQFKKIIAGTNITLSSNATGITINSSGSGGGSNSMRNLGSSGQGVYYQTSGSEFQLKKIKAGSNISLSSDSESITITGTPNSLISGDTSIEITDSGSGGYIVFKNDNVERMRLLSTGYLGIGTNNPGARLEINGAIRLDGSSSGYVGLKAPSAPTSLTYTLPSNDGSNGEALTTNGSGTLSWSSVGSSLTVREVDGNPSISNVSVIEFDQSTGLNVTDQGSNVARVSLGSHWKNLVVSGQTTLTPTGEEPLELIAGTGMTITTNSSSNPKSITFSSSGGSSSWSTSGSNLYYTAGNIGIGTNSPSVELETKNNLLVSKESSHIKNYFNQEYSYVFNPGSFSSIGSIASGQTVTFDVDAATVNITSGGTGAAQFPSGTGKLLLHFDDNITDSSGNNFTRSSSGISYNASTPFSSGKSLQLSGGGTFSGGSWSSPSYVQVEYNNDLRLYNNNFTIEFWFYASNGGTVLSSWGGSNSSFYIDLKDRVATFVAKLATSTSNADSGTLSTNGQFTLSTGSNIYNLSAWNHFALVRSGNYFNIYINGTSQASGNINHDDYGKYIVSPSSSTDALTIGSLNRSGSYTNSTTWFTGYLDDITFINGTSKYINSFTPSGPPIKVNMSTVPYDEPPDAPLLCVLPLPPTAPYPPPLPFP